MNLTCTLYKTEDVHELLQKGMGENKDVILGFKEVSRFFETTKEDCLSLARTLNDCGLKVFLQWDILMTEDSFGGLIHGLKVSGLFDLTKSPFAGIRVQDTGLLYALKEMNYQGEVHLICEQGNHNLTGLKSWYNFWPQGIKRLVLSPQLPATTLKEYAKALKEDSGVELEVLAMGPLLLFYTPRKLVSPLYGEESPQEVYKVSGTSEESPHKGFPIIENRHGTFMLNTKDQFIFDELVGVEQDLLNTSGLYWRIDPICGLGDLSWVELLENLKAKSQESEVFENLKRKYARSVTKGFFRVNKTDVLFKKLKNHRLQDRDESFVGEVVDVKKKNHVAVLIKSEKGLKRGDALRLLSPEGREKFVTVDRMSNALSGELSEANKGQIVFIPPVGGISVRSMVYKESPKP